MKIFIDWGFPFDRELFFSKFKEEKDPFKADVCIWFSTYRNDVGKAKSIMIQCEPPIADHRIMCYSTAAEFHTVYTFNPDPDKPNQFPLAFKSPLCFPYYPRQDLVREFTRRVIRDRGVYFASARYGFERTPDSFGAVNLYPVRERIVTYLRGNHQPMFVYGSGWGTADTGMWNDSEGCQDWRVRKLQEMEHHDIDFSLASESCRLRGYISEKIWDAINSGRCVLYLGNPDIQQLIPSECFYDLAEYIDWESKKIDYAGILSLIKNVTDDEYGRTVGRMQEWYRSLDTDAMYRENRELLTRHVMERLS